MSTDPRGTLSSSGADFVKNQHDTYKFINPKQHNLQGKHVLITGASKGIGKATCISFAQAGASGIAIAARSDLSALTKEIERAATSAGKEAPTVVSVSMDVTKRESVEAAAKQVSEKLGHLDIIVVNAGALESFKPITEQDPDAWWSTWETNILGPYLTLRSFLPLTLNSPNKYRTVVGLSSIGAHIVMPGASAYQPSKLALLRILEFVNTEYGEQGVLAYAVHPGGIMTELASKMGEQYHSLLSDTPELASDSIAWLTSERREWLAGRYVSCTWDMEEFLKKKQAIVDGDLLKVRLAVE